ncbi:MAG: hypothetical protein LBP22_03720 [Deltaproteobacteria bacterium]|jgi:hypothetical protein|nr:hypothetical protein [Deltaproteobacteria bacterium]
MKVNDAMSDPSPRPETVIPSGYKIGLTESGGKIGPLPGSARLRVLVFQKGRFEMQEIWDLAEFGLDRAGEVPEDAPWQRLKSGKSWRGFC